MVTVKTIKFYYHHLNLYVFPSLFFSSLSVILRHFIPFSIFTIILSISSIARILKKHTKNLIWRGSLNKERNITSKPFESVWFIHLFYLFLLFDLPKSAISLSLSLSLSIYIYIYIYMLRGWKIRYLVWKKENTTYTQRIYYTNQYLLYTNQYCIFK